jgi:hypothetical protein
VIENEQLKKKEKLVFAQAYAPLAIEDGSGQRAKKKESVRILKNDIEHIIQNMKEDDE